MEETFELNYHQLAHPYPCGKTDICTRLRNMAVESYLIFAFVSCIFNPYFGVLAVYFSMKSKQVKGGKARFFSDMAYGFAFVGIIVSIIVIVELYAFRTFPESAYFDRDQLIRTSTS
ncbi:hypothetical protein LSH36_965g01009 [Paralvinella palmiformis]|uniref:Uncharacterized protein n=1 Tax=Paralvinella palmiformis TaxID=53620 RepID=A0AAD9IY01_9ANNE|nr:hypothetical protein LSH36_965g01009 [Paralvinella palmiformis]